MDEIEELTITPSSKVRKCSTRDLPMIVNGNKWLLGGDNDYSKKHDDTSTVGNNNNNNNQCEWGGERFTVEHIYTYIYVRYTFSISLSSHLI